MHGAARWRRWGTRMALHVASKVLWRCPSSPEKKRCPPCDNTSILYITQVNLRVVIMPRETGAGCDRTELQSLGDGLPCVSMGATALHHFKCTVSGTHTVSGWACNHECKGQAKFYIRLVSRSQPTTRHEALSSSKFSSRGSAPHPARGYRPWTPKSKHFSP